LLLTHLEGPVYQKFLILS